MVTVVPISKHYCSGMIVHETMFQNGGLSYCGHQTMLKDCCYTDTQFYIEDYSVNITFSSFEAGELYVSRIEDFIPDYNLKYDQYNLTNKYRTTSDIQPKNEVGLYKYVQSFLI